MSAMPEGERIVAVVPIRSFHNGKSRLTPVLARSAREALLRETAGRVVAAAIDSGRVASVLVISDDEDVLAWADRIGPHVTAFPQPLGSPGLNGAVHAAKAWAGETAASAVLSLFADLPFVSRDDIVQFVERHEPVVLGPDRRGEGTNALLLRLAGNGASFQFAFGEGSLARHIEEARRLGLEAGIARLAGLGFDLDTPADWEEFVTARLETDEEPGLRLAPCGAVPR